MKKSLQEKLESLTNRYDELGIKLSDPEVINDLNQFRDYSKEYTSLKDIVSTFKQYQQQTENLTNLEQMLNDTDVEIRALAEEEIKTTQMDMQDLEAKLQLLLLPSDPDDNRNVYLEIRAGAGGDEAAIFAGDLFRMYSRYAELKKWHIETINLHAGEHGGYKEIISKITGNNVYAQLKFESGAHRVQRVPATETQGRIHTSTCTVAILAEVEEVEEIVVNPAELKIDTYRASGAGGQHVNKTDSAVRITHIPSGTVVECQEERSQHKNRAKAMSLLQARLLAAERTKQQKERAQKRKSLIGTGDRSERIRTYNFPQGRLTDHRINLTLYKLESIMEGHMEEVIQPLRQEYQAELLEEFGE